MPKLSPSKNILKRKQSLENKILPVNENEDQEASFMDDNGFASVLENKPFSPRGYRSCSSFYEYPPSSRTDNSSGHTTPESCPISPRDDLSDGISKNIGNETTRDEASDEIKKHMSRTLEIIGLPYMIQNLHLLISSTYAQKLPDNLSKWKSIADSSHIQNTAGFYGQVWVNTEHKQLVFVCSGTKIDKGLSSLIKDAVNDAQLALGIIPSQFDLGVMRFIDDIINNQQDRLLKEVGVEYEDLKQYSLIFTGHSLGAALADGAALVAQKHRSLFKDIKSITMENPGSKTLMENIYQDRKKYGRGEVNLEEVKESYYIVNNTPNLINATLEQCTERVFLNEHDEYLHNEEEGSWLFKLLKKVELFNDAYCAIQKLRHDHQEKFFKEPKLKIYENWPLNKAVNFLENIEKQIIDSIKHPDPRALQKYTESCMKSAQQFALPICISISKTALKSLTPAMYFYNKIPDYYSVEKFWNVCDELRESIEEFNDIIHPNMWSYDYD
ncbi:MAG: hypothetical protein EB127_11890 [Alphaproteobacteria bacterium]|nr:hypothetical protein [Alphaproteobacteria bacterium]